MATVRKPGILVPCTKWGNRSLREGRMTLVGAADVGVSAARLCHAALFWGTRTAQRRSGQPGVYWLKPLRPDLHIQCAWRSAAGRSNSSCVTCAWQLWLFGMFLPIVAPIPQRSKATHSTKQEQQRSATRFDKTGNSYCKEVALGFEAVSICRGALVVGVCRSKDVSSFMPSRCPEYLPTP